MSVQSICCSGVSLSASVRSEILFVLDINADSIEFLVTANATGWVGFGLSPNGGMIGSDMVMGAIDPSGTILFSQRHATAHALPAADPSQDYTLIELSEANGWTTMHFMRNTSGCDPDDIGVAFGLTNRVVAAFRRVDKPVGEFEPSMTLQHDWRVSVSVELLTGIEPVYPADATGTIEINFQNAYVCCARLVCHQFLTVFVCNSVIPAGQQTNYWWLGAKLNVTQRTHVIGFEPIIPDSEIVTTHHMLLYHCPGPLDAAALAYVGSKDAAGVPQTLAQCDFLNPIAGWAVRSVLCCIVFIRRNASRARVCVHA
jgi:hypothetical protein